MHRHDVLRRLCPHTALPGLVAVALVLGSSCVVDVTGARCTSDEHCPEGQFCDLAAEPPVCRLGEAPDGGVRPTDAGTDAGAAADAGTPLDGGSDDAGTPDAGPSDAGVGDAGVGDAGAADAGSGDAGAADAGPRDAGLDDGGTCAGGCTASGPCACAVFDFHPKVASLGTTIVFEGHFASGTTVTFPGSSAAIGLRLLGSTHRGTAVVPADAKVGPITISTNGVSVFTPPFRRTTFEPGLGRFDPEYEQLAYARPMTKLKAPRERHTAHVIDHWLYLVGGPPVERARVNADGTLDDFREVSPALPLPLDHAAARIGNFLYVLGGRATTSSSALGQVVRLAIGADGSLDTANPTVIGSLAVERWGHGCAIVGDHLYVFGGEGLAQNVLLDSIERAPIRPDGSLGAFTLLPSTVKLDVGRRSFATAKAGDHVFLLGGVAFVPGPGNTPVNSSSFATVFGSELSAFSPSSQLTLRAPRQRPAAIVLGQRLTVVGGRNDVGVPTLIAESVPLNPTTGAPMTSFSDDPRSSLTQDRAGFALAVTGNAVHALGGVDGSRTPVSTVERATLYGSPNPLASFVGSLGDANNVGRVVAPVVVGSNLYLLGGGAGGATRVFAVGPDGALGASSDTAGAIPFDTGFRAAVSGGALYVVGGATTGDGGVDPVQTQVSPDGGLTGFTTLSPPVLESRPWASPVFVGDRLYVLGGLEGGAPSATVTVSQLLPDGGLALDSLLPPPLPDGIYGAVPYVTRQLFLVGGQSASSMLDSTIVGTIDASGLSSFGLSLSPNAWLPFATGYLRGDTLVVFGGGAFGASATTVAITTGRSDAGVEGALLSASTLALQSRDAPGQTVIVLGNFLHVFPHANVIHSYRLE